MTLVQSHRGAPVKLRLARDLTRAVKRGNPWIFADALRERPPARPGAVAVLLDNKKGRELAYGFYDPHSPLAFRACAVDPAQPPDDAWAAARFDRALALRRRLFNPTYTTGFRLFNGEGDGLPGLVCDVYGDTAVLQLDGAGPTGFWNAAGIARRLAQKLPVTRVYLRAQARTNSPGQALVGLLPELPAAFLENGLHFSADVVNGQKTGFFLDQRDNRRLMGELAAGSRVLNLFGYTGGFSVYAGQGGAQHVTTVDLAAPALEAAHAHWQLNHLAPGGHHAVQADAFQFLEQAARQKEAWEMVVVDPPSFAPNKQSVPKAVTAYRGLIAAAAGVTTPNGLLAAASCSSHIRADAFLQLCEEAVSQARRRATLLGLFDQPPDHPTPLALPEFRYLKFVLMQVD
jgi:23S rRNA (cytosine1962-C5)-methyltransferase